MRNEPWGVMCIAKFGWPRIDGSSRFEQCWVSMRKGAIKLVLSIFFLGKEAWKLSVSSLMPRNSMDLLGPAVFSGARGTPSFPKTLWTLQGCADGADFPAARLIENRPVGG